MEQDNVTVGFGQAREGVGDISISTSFFGSKSYDITIDNSVGAGNSKYSVSHVLAHEGGHGYFHSAGLSVPKFREEGLAQRYGNAVDWGLNRSGPHRLLGDGPAQHQNNLREFWRGECISRRAKNVEQCVSAIIP